MGGLKVPAIVEGYLGGEGIGEATADVLFGKVNPSGKLPESFPLRLSDTPSWLNFPGKNRHCRYAKAFMWAIAITTRKRCPCVFPSGHGLSYTKFDIPA